MTHTYYTTHTVARLLGASPSTVLSWVDKGLLNAHRTPGGHRRIAKPDLVGFLHGHRMPIPSELRRVERLLVIDDEPVFLRTARGLLRSTHPELTVETADGAVDGLLHVITFQPDAVLLDAYMPDMHGPEVCRRLCRTEATAHIRVVALTGRPSEELARELVEAGAVACLTKPLDVRELMSALEDASTTTDVAG